MIQVRCAWRAGMDPKKTRPYRRDRYYKSAMHAAVEYPDLAMLRCEGSRTASAGAEDGGLLPGTEQVNCSVSGKGPARSFWRSSQGMAHTNGMPAAWPVRTV